MPTASSNGISIYYEIRGDGRPLIFIPGLGTDITEYRPILTWLEARFRVLAVDNRGAGRSDKPDQPYTIEQMAEDTAAVARAVELGPAAVLGISRGGRIALALTVAHPELVSRLVLVSTSARGRRTRRVGLLSLFHALPRLRGAYPQPRYAFERQRAASFAFDCSAELDRIRVPTLILHGRLDRIVPFDWAAATQRGIAGSRLIPCDGGHLFFMLREKQRFLEEVAAFLQV